MTLVSTARGADYKIEFRDADIKSAVRMLAKIDGKNIVVPDKVTGKVTASFSGTNMLQAIESILKANSFGVIADDGVLLVIPKVFAGVSGQPGRYYAFASAQ